MVKKKNINNHSYHQTFNTGFKSPEIMYVQQNIRNTQTNIEQRQSYDTISNCDLAGLSMSAGLENVVYPP